MYSYSYEADAIVPQIPQESWFTRVKEGLTPLFARKRMRFLTIMLAQAVLLTSSTGIYLGMHAASASNEQKESVLSSTTEVTPSTPPTETPAPPSPTPTPNIEKLLNTPSKKLYKIAVIGDSMVDTMGEVMEYLDDAMQKKYPDTRFLFYNYGIGAQNVAQGFDRVSKRFDYNSRHYPSITEIEADLIIVGSFAYNPFSPHDRDRHWLTLTALVQTLQRTNASVYMLAEIAPLRDDFGKGPHGVNWETATAIEHSGRIVEQLQNAQGLSKTLNVPIIDVFTPSLNPDNPKKEAKREYVNPDDGIHPSVRGHEFTADIIADQIVLP